MRTVPQLAARCDVNIGYGGIVESCGTCIGENGLEYIMAISAEGSGYYPLRHPATGEPLFAAEEVHIPAELDFISRVTEAWGSGGWRPGVSLLSFGRLGLGRRRCGLMGPIVCAQLRFPCPCR